MTKYWIVFLSGFVSENEKRDNAVDINHNFMN